MIRLAANFWSFLSFPAHQVGTEKRYNLKGKDLQTGASSFLLEQTIFQKVFKNYKKKYNLLH